MRAVCKFKKELFSFLKKKPHAPRSKNHPHLQTAISPKYERFLVPV